MWYAMAMSSRSLIPPSRGSAFFWAVASIITLPLALLVFPGLGVSAAVAFLLGIAATLLVLLCNVALEGSLWMHHNGWHTTFDDPQAAHRLAVVSGAILLIVESAVIVYVLISPGVDEALLSLLLQRQCAQPTSMLFLDLCQTLLR